MRAIAWATVALIAIYCAAWLWMERVFDDDNQWHDDADKEPPT